MTAQLKDKLIQQALERRLRHAAQSDSAPLSLVAGFGATDKIPEQHYRFHLHPGYQQIRIMNDGAARLGIGNPFFKLHEGTAGNTTVIGGKSYINYASYNYLGLSGHSAVIDAAKAAIDRYGTSVSASRLVSGDRPVHRELEHALANVYGVEDAITLDRKSVV